MRTTFPILMVLALATPLAFTGCDRTVSEQTKTTTDREGNQAKETKTVTQSPNGDTTVTQEKSKTVTNNP